jgi:calcium-dependent protein kinase
MASELHALSLLDHPGIVKFHETFEDDVFVYIVMEYCDGGELFATLT